MAETLVLNAGSSSLKYTLYHGKERIDSGKVERIGEAGYCSGHKEAILAIVKQMKDKGVLKSEKDITVIGHRIVHGGDITKPTLITPGVLDKLKTLIELAPLHNGPETLVVEICLDMFRHAKQCAVFDTSFHSTIPEMAYLYGIPYGLKDKMIRRYGFHGSSHEYVSKQAAILLGGAKCRIITCHLGAGSSIAAVKDGRCVDTSMGLTPLEGVIMATRGGDIDPGVILRLMTKEGMTPDRISQMLNNESGLLGISGISKDVRDLLCSDRPRAKLALDMFCYRVKKYIGSYAAVLGGVDAIVFTAGIGENVGSLRAQILDGCEYLGVAIDPEKNSANQQEISAKKSKVKVFVIPTDEELVIAQHCRALVK